MKTILSIFLSFLFFSGTAQQVVITDANAEARALSGSFNSVKVSGGIDIYLTQGKDEAVAVSAVKEKYLSKIKTEVKNGTLWVYYEENSGVHVNIGSKEMKVYISFKNLEKIHASGASDVHVLGQIEVSTLALELSGASDFHGAIKTTNLSVDCSGASDATITGSATNSSIEASGASDIKSYELSTDFCNIKASGASKINITVNKELNVRASGASSINYKGEAAIKGISSSGSGSVNKKD